MKAYSMDLRERILRAYDGGMPKSVIVSTFGVSRSTVSSYVARRRMTGSVAPKPIPGRVANLRRGQYPELRAQLREFPDATLAEHCEMWKRSHHLSISVSAMHRAIRNAGWTRKKR